MVVNVQMTMTNVKKMAMLNIQLFFFSIHYERKAYKLKETSFCDSQ